MPEYIQWQYPDISEEVNKLLMQDDKKLVIVGVIGKSAFPDCNKMVALDVLDRHPSLLKHDPKEGQIQFYYNPLESLLFVHFETTYDAACMQKMLLEELEQNTFDQFLTFHQKVRNRFARMFLFATQVCHLIIFVELSVTFDASLLGVFKALKIIRDCHVLKFLPKFMKNSSTGFMLGKTARLCSPRVLFLFENLPNGHEKTKEAISKSEFDVEDNIYKMLRNEFIVVNNSNHSLFSIPANLRFVYYNLNDKLREDPLLKSIEMLHELIQKPNFNQDDDEDLDDLLPFKGFGKPLNLNMCETKAESLEELYAKNRKFKDLLMEHVDQAFKTGFNDNITKFKGKNHFVLLPFKSWFETFKMFHKMLIENPDNPSFEANDPDYKSYLDNFDKILNYDSEFFKSCCDIGLQKAFSMYNNPTLTFYSGTVHKKLVEEAVALYMKYARGPDTATNEAQLREMCESCWKNGKEQCEYPSLRGNPCARPKHTVKETTEHTSRLVFISACNCGKTQGRREDPYSIRHANYEFYEYMASNCNLCAKVKRINFAIFEPSINDFRAAEFESGFPRLSLSDNHDMASHCVASNLDEEQFVINNSQPLTASQGTHTNLSLSVSLDNLNKIDDQDNDINSSEESLNELILKVKDKDIQLEDKERSIIRQPSTTEYLPGMTHTESPMGLLPQFPSWSLCCVGASSVYSHNNGLQEHFQSGFLSGSNFLLPWDVHVRLEHSAQWAYEMTRYRKMGEVFVLKIFVGFEYECPRGHRFMMSAPDKILRGGSGILRDSGSKVVYNNMPLYYPCPCRTKKFDVAQLMRVHVVTPKAPVNVSLDPKVRTGDRDFVFILGLSEPPKLSQSAYWILRLPYVYQGDEGHIPPPTEITAANALQYGCLMAGMFGVSEVEADD